MRPVLLLLAAVISVHAGNIEIPDTEYEFEYDSTWKLLPKSTETKGLWAFSDHLLYLGAGLMLLDSGSADGIDAKDMIEAMAGDYEKTEEMKSIPACKTFRSYDGKGDKERWTLCIVEERFMLFTFVEGPHAQMKLRESAVKAFLTGIKKKQ